MLDIFIQETKYSPANDLVLWTSFQQGDLTAFAEIYSLQVQSLYNYGCKLTKDKTLVEDCIQDLFIEIWKSREKLSSTDNIKYYLFKCLRRKLVKKIHESEMVEHEISDVSVFGLSLSPESDLITNQQDFLQKASLQKALKTLTKRQKEAIFLKFYQNLSFQEVASVMSLGMKSTYNLISKALETLRQNLHKSDVYEMLIFGIFLFLK